MADAKISGLSAVTSVGATDEAVLAVGGATKKITGANLIKSAAAGTRPQLALTARGLLAETSPLLNCLTSTAPGNNARRATLIGLRAGDVITNIVVCVTVLGTSTAPTNIFVGLYNSSFASVAVSADLAASTIWTAATGPQIAPLSSPYTVPSSGGYYCVFIQNGAFAGTALSLATSTFAVAGATSALTGGVPLAGVQTGQTELTTTLSLSATGAPHWYGVN